MSAARDGAEIAYAREVYAACATVGFASDTGGAPETPDRRGTLAAQTAQRESIAWAGRTDRPGISGTGPG